MSRNAPSFSFSPGAQIEQLESRVLYAAVPHGFTDITFATGLTRPTAMEFAPDGRLFVTEQTGDLRVITRDGTLLPTPFLHVDTDSAGERGLIGITFDPDFETNHFLYIYYTTEENGVHNRLSRFTANGDVAEVGSETPLLDLEPLSGATNHNGGGIHFGPDGKLYVGVGENANGANAQTLTNRLGKILRINSDGSTPADNPFVNEATGDNRAVWALGLRNPFTFAFQPGSTGLAAGGTGRMFINDVGQNTREEIDDGIAGSNYGWPETEGPTTDPRFRAPLLSYPHGNTSDTGIAITGGTFYNPVIEQFPGYDVGDYFFADLGSGWIRRFDPATGKNKLFATGIEQPVDLDVSNDGSLYYLAIGSGSVGRIRSNDAKPPKISKQPKDRTTREGRGTTFSVKARGLGTFQYQWQRDKVDISGATSSSLTLPSLSRAADNRARFRVVITNEFGSVTSRSAKLSVKRATS